MNLHWLKKEDTVGRFLNQVKVQTILNQLIMHHTALVVKKRKDIVDTVDHTSLERERGSVDHLLLDQAARIKDTADQTHPVVMEKDMEDHHPLHLLLDQVYQVKVRGIVDLHLELSVKEKATVNHLPQDQVKATVGQMNQVARVKDTVDHTGQAKEDIQSAKMMAPLNS